MERIALNDNQKRLLRAIQRGESNLEIAEWDIEDANVLIQENLIQVASDKAGGLFTPRLTDNGRAYIHQNPKLKNPSIWEDKKYWITTSISLVALIMSIHSTYNQWIILTNTENLNCSCVMRVSSARKMGIY